MALGLKDIIEGINDGIRGNSRDKNPVRTAEPPKTSDVAGAVSPIVKERAKEVVNKINGYKDIIGMPPLTYHNINGNSGFDSNGLLKIDNGLSWNDWHVLASMTILHLNPGWPNYMGINGDSGLQLYSVNDASGRERYNKLLQEAGIASRLKSNGPLRVAVVNDYQITESFSSDYQESMFESIADVGSNMGRELKAVTGAATFDEGLGKLGNIASDTANSLGVGSLGDVAKQLLSQAQDFSKNLTAGNKVAEAAKNIAIGNKVDFPMIWTNSTYSPSYQFTCRLYNPFPGSEEHYIKYIVEPLIHLVAFMVPYSEDSQSYSFPVLCSVNGGGLINIKGGYMSNLDAVFGGESNDIAFKQQPNQVDVRFTINNLYSTMIGKVGSDNIIEDRPTLKSFVHGLKNYAEIEYKPEIGPEIINGDNIIMGSITKNIFNNIVDKKSRGFRSITDPAPNNDRISTEDLIALTDPVLDSDTLDTDLLNQISSYRNDVQKIITKQGIIPEEMLVALRIRNNIPVPQNISTWFWNNLDTFSDQTRSIVSGIVPTNQLIVGGLTSVSNTPVSQGMM